ncbi:hypothetical protein D3C79_995120 [compost metagenome]
MPLGDGITLHGGIVELLHPLLESARVLLGQGLFAQRVDMLALALQVRFAETVLAQALDLGQ